MSRLARILVIFSLVHLSLAGIYCQLISSTPVSEMRISTFSDGIILFGKNRFNFLAVQFFSGWSELNSYMHQNSLVFQERFVGPESIAYPQTLPQEFMSQGKRENYFSLQWRTQLSQTFRQVIHTPDIETLTVFKQALENGNVSPSLFGHSIKILNL